MERPPEFILIPMGEYNGVDLPNTWIDKHYTVWLIVLNPERECEVSF